MVSRCVVDSMLRLLASVPNNRKELDMGVIWTIVLGFVIGVLAKFLHPGKENMGFIMTVLLGIAGFFWPAL